MSAPCLICYIRMQARKNAEAVELAVRLDRLQQQAGSSMVTTNTLVSMDEDDDSALKRFNIILKVRTPVLICKEPASLHPEHMTYCLEQKPA